MRRCQPSAARRSPAAGERGGVLAVGAIGAAILLVAAVAGVAAVALSAQAWARGMRDEQTLPPGTVVAGTEVGGMRLAQASARVDQAVAARMREPITVVAGDAQWQVTPRELGARAESDEAVREALTRATSADPFRLVWARWFGGSVEVAVPMTVDAQRAGEVTRGWAEEFNRGIRDATLTWSQSGVELVEHHDARQLAPDELAERLVAAAREGRDRVEAHVSRSPASVTTEQVRALADTARRLTDRALHREVRVTGGGQQWTVSPADVGAEPDVAAWVDARLGDDGQAADGGDAAASVPMEVSEEQVHEYVHRLADEVDTAGRDAQVRLDGDRLTVSRPAQRGRTVQHDAATDALAEALRGGADSVELPVARTEPSLTADDFDSALVLRQSERRVYHYVNGEAVADWPVAVGAGGSPTPTGVFTVGVKRHRPTWYNPDPDGWGADMPEMVGPGPTNPLGVRALNWYDDGRDTLIRFHGTAVTNSIGRAASQGCVRLTNDDIRQLYSRVPTGTPIVSVRR